MDVDDEALPITTETDWWHARVSFPGGAGVSPEAAQALSSGLGEQRFHFLRKEGGLRLRTEHRRGGPVGSPRRRWAGQRLVRRHL
ncbi:hypothetical protein [Streptomyces ipomoeae]|uniref:hypothetical protein n=1 Tax=Streptomyces ipomoeae TaxID=103232 RepID=UPI0029B56787|nr:hypothetical protein [Streptomyces ipomoeae]MDX2875639.1 hypothetical protein [Streptomyces ipomoeae]